MSKIILRCIKEKSKLCIKFFSFVDNEGKINTNIYNNKLNCKFPKDIRKEGYFYEIRPEYLSIVNSNGKLYYNVKNKDIKMLPDFDISFIKVFEVNGCLICSDFTDNIPCGHKCLCTNCNNQYIIYK
jgi:hypothetical protein